MQGSAAVTIRKAEPADAEAITEIYNDAILHTTATFDTEPKSVAERAEWLKSHDDRHPVLVAMFDGRVAGWTSLTQWSDRCAYADTAETSFYVHAAYRGRGIGRKLKEAIIEEARRLRFHSLIARVAEGSDASLHLNERAGFVHVGTLKEVGRKFGRLLDVHIMQKILNPPAPNPDCSNTSNDSSLEIVPTEIGYDRWAEVYDGDDNPLIQLEEQHIGPFLGDVAGLEVVDVGCGTGRHALRLAAAGARVTAIDFSEAMLRRARAKAGAEVVRFVRHDLAEPLPLESAAFDRVLCLLVIDHVANLDGLFRESKRICRPNGFVLVSVMHPAMSLRGVQARFTDPVSGRRIAPASRVHRVSDYLMAAARTGLRLAHMSEHEVDSILAARSPRAAKYLGWPLLLLLKWDANDQRHE